MRFYRDERFPERSFDRIKKRAETGDSIGWIESQVSTRLQFFSKIRQVLIRRKAFYML